MIEVKATYKKGDVDQECTILYDFKETAEEAIGAFGAEVVHSNFIRASKVTAQAAMRRLLEAGKTEEEVQSAMDAWRPGVALERSIDPLAATLAKFGKLTPEEQAKFIADLQARRNK
jgi:glutaminase